MKKIVLTGGGTAGHVYPALAIKEELNNDYEFHYIGGNGMEKNILSDYKDIIYHQISTVKLERKFTFQNLLIPFKLIKSINQSKKILKEIKPNIIFSKGGFVAVPVVIAAHKLGIPIISHESDLTLGLENKIILHYCDKMCVAFEKTSSYNSKCIYTGQPIRKKVLKGNKKKIKFENSDKSKPYLLVMGGSTGAKFINEKVWKNLNDLTKNFNVIHITGKQAKDVKHHKNYLQVPYAENIGDYIDLADIVLSRAGSGAINEFLTLKKPMLLIPLSKKCSRGDQIENAKLFTKLGYSEIMEEEDYDDKMFMIKIKNLYQNKEKYIKNMQNAKIPNANEKIKDLIEQIEK